MVNRCRMGRAMALAALLLLILATGTLADSDMNGSGGAFNMGSASGDSGSGSDNNSPSFSETLSETLSPTTTVTPVSTRSAGGGTLPSSTAAPSASMSSHLTSQAPSRTHSSLLPSETSAPPPSPVPTSSQEDSDSSNNPPIGLSVGVGVLGAVLMVILLLVVITSVYICFKYISAQTGRNKQRRNNDINLSHSVDQLLDHQMADMNGSTPSCTYEELFTHIPIIAPVELSQFQSYVEALHGDEAEEEYQDVRDIDEGCSIATASLPCNEERNRYINILPNEDTRVLLRSPIPKPSTPKRSSSSHSDYINANYISGYSSQREYIATQGPLPNTVGDFWEMVWGENCHTIVMVTNLTEREMIKCHQYWPSKGALCCGKITVSPQQQLVYPDYTVRTFSLSLGKKALGAGEARTVVQYHFTSWPDFGVPSDSSTMIKFVRRVRSSVQDDHGPIITHCSAGVGRTGTFIAIDVMLQKIDNKEPLNIMDFVCRMRAQRSRMVQTCSQYMFIYDAVLHAYLYGNTEVGVAQIRDYVTALDEKKNGQKQTQLDTEFQHLMSLPAPSSHSTTIALSKDNTGKNRDNNNIPLNRNSVALEIEREGGCYINASLMEGYSKRKELVATQHPLPHTMADFWLMVLERDIAMVVMIGPQDEAESYLPGGVGKESERVFGDISVRMVRCEEVGEEVTVRELELECEGTETLNVHHYNLSAWPVDGTLPTSPQGMLTLLHETRQCWAQTGFRLMSVHTSSKVSGEATGVFCALRQVKRQLELEGSGDVLTTCMRLRQQRPAILTSKEYYRFIYTALVASLEHP